MIRLAAILGNVIVCVYAYLKDTEASRCSSKSKTRVKGIGTILHLIYFEIYYTPSKLLKYHLGG